MPFIRVFCRFSFPGNEFWNFIRFERIEILSPKLSERYLSNQRIKFLWKTSYKGQLGIKITDNKGNEIFTFDNTKKSKFVIKEKFQPGLYYWKLETFEELIYIGRFIIVTKE